MTINIAPVTAAAARTPSPSGSKENAPAEALPAGNDQSAIGEKLPVAEVDAQEYVARAVDRLNELMAQSQRSLRFQFDELSGRTIITVLDEETQKVVRQIPPPELLAVVRRLEQNGSLIEALG